MCPDILKGYKMDEKIFERLEEKEKKYRDELKIVQQYNIRDAIDKYQMLLEVIEYIKTGKKITNTSYNI